MRNSLCRRCMTMLDIFITVYCHSSSTEQVPVSMKGMLHERPLIAAVPLGRRLLIRQTVVHNAFPIYLNLETLRRKYIYDYPIRFQGQCSFECKNVILNFKAGFEVQNTQESPIA